MDDANRSSRIRLAALVLFVLAAGAYGWWIQRAPDAGPPSVRQVTIAQFGDFFLYAPLYVAVDNGHFKNHNLDVSIVNTGGDDKTWAAVVGGSAQFGVADPTFVAVSAERGQPGVVVANLVNGVPFWGIAFKDMPQITNPTELGKYSVATFPSPSTAYTLQKKMFVDGGLPVNIREGAFGAIIPMVSAGRADIGLELEPNVSLAATQGAKVIYSLAERYGDFAITGVTTTPAIAQTEGALVTDVRSALQDALDVIHSSPDTALRLLAKRFPEVPVDVAKAALTRVARDRVIPSSVSITRDAWDKAIALRRDVGDLKAPAPYDRFVWNGAGATR